jgi:hypothetical protein
MSSLTLRMRGNRGGPRLGPLEAGTREQAIKSEDAGGGARKSEPPIVVSIPGNAGGAKGWRFETACDRYTALHREDSVRDN